MTRLAALVAGGLEPGELEEANDIVFDAQREMTEDPTGFPGLVETVPEDPRRHLLFKDQYIAQHFVTSGQPVGHGFTPENLVTQQGNYAFEPKPGIRFIVLDSVADNGGDRGNIDDPQFQWLDGQLAAADAAHDLAVVFAHHTLETMNQPHVSGFPPGDNPPVPNPHVHFGENGPNERCPGTPPAPLESLKCLMLRHRSVVAYVAGHEHQNRIRAVPRSGQTGDPTGPATGGFWQIVTAAHIDWPQQSRLLDIVDNPGGTLSIFGTLLDHAAPPHPGGAPPSDGLGAATPETMRLASISRELSFNDPDSENGEDGRPDARGGEGDRNVELVVRDPRGP
jgi:hypothetical protein